MSKNPYIFRVEKMTWEERARERERERERDGGGRWFWLLLIFALYGLVSTVEGE